MNVLKDFKNKMSGMINKVNFQKFKIMVLIFSKIDLIQKLNSHHKLHKEYELVNMKCKKNNCFLRVIYKRYKVFKKNHLIFNFL